MFFHPLGGPTGYRGTQSWAGSATEKFERAT
jgi:hypothetical protein